MVSHFLHSKFESGHYLSELRHWQQALRLLRDLGVSWPEGTRLTLFDRYRYISRKLPASVLETPELLPRLVGL